MYQLIRERIKAIRDNDWNLRDLRTYVIILTEKLSLLNESSFNSIEQYSNSLRLFNEYLTEQPIHNFQYFNQSKNRILRILDALIDTMGKKKDIIPADDWVHNFNDDANLFLAVYEQEHIGFFQMQPAMKVSFYKHGRLEDNYIMHGKQILFNSKTELTPQMQDDIKEQIEYFAAKYA